MLIHWNIPGSHNFIDKDCQDFSGPSKCFVVVLIYYRADLLFKFCDKIFGISRKSLLIRGQAQLSTCRKPNEKLISRFGGEVWSAADGNVGKRFGLQDFEDMLFFQHQQCVEVGCSILARDPSRWDQRAETGLGRTPAGTQGMMHCLVHTRRIGATTAFYLFSSVQLFHLQQQQWMLLQQLL